MPTSSLPNRYASQDLFLSGTVSERLKDLVARGEADASKPFRRQVDAWWLGFCIGVHNGERTPFSNERVKFNDGAILASDPWRITHIELFALDELGQESLDNPAQVIRTVSEYANTGLEWLTEKLLGEAEPTLSLIIALGDLPPQEQLITE